MIGLGLNAAKTPTTNTNIVRSVDAGGGARGSSSSLVNALVLRHDYKDRPVELCSSGAAFFNGSSDYIDCGDIGAAKSLAFWFKPLSSINASTAYQRVFGFSSSYYGVSLGASTGSISGEVLTVLPDNSSRTATTTTFDSNTWYHACISWNASSNYFDIYINGILSTDLSTNTHTLADWDSFIMGTDNTTGTHFGGYMCNVGIWSAALTQPQIKSIMHKDYAALSASEKTNLVSWWNLDSTVEDLGTAVYDNHNSGLGSELINNGSFETNLDGWTTDWWQWNALGAYHPVSGSHKPLYQQAFVVGEVYLITFDINVIQGSAKFSLGTNTGNTSEVIASALGTGSYSYVVRATYEYIVFNRNNGGSNNEYYVNNVSVKLINGNPGTLA